MARGPIRGAALVIMGLLLTSCGGANETAVPTPEDLAAALLTAEDLGAPWIPAADFAAGVLSDEWRDQLSLPELCPAADAAAVEAAAALQWQAGAAFTRGEAPDGGYVPSVVQLLLTGEPDQIAADFAALRRGFAACAGTDQVFESEGTFHIESVPLPEAGDDRIGLRYQQTDAPADHVHFDMRLMLVRHGAVIMWLNETEITLEAEPEVPASELGDIVTAAAGNLP